MAQRLNQPPIATVTSHRAVTIVLSAIAVIGVILAVLIWLGSSATPISTPVITTRFDSTAGALPPHETTVSADSPTIYALVKIHTRKQATVVAKWYYNGEHLTAVDTSQDIPAGYEDWFAFKITNSQPWPTGTYKVEFYLTGEKQTEQTFQIP